MNVFRTPRWNSKTKAWERPLDLKFLRVCAVRKLLGQGCIGEARGIELLAEIHTPAEMKALRGTVQLWREFIPKMLP